MLKFENGTIFADKTVEFFFQEPSEHDSSKKIMVNVTIDPETDFHSLAMVDTGCPWFVCKPEIAKKLNLDEKEKMGRGKLCIRGETIEGSLHRMQIWIRTVDEESVYLQVTAFVPDDTEEYALLFPEIPYVLGYKSCLERLNIAIEPPGKDDKGRMFLKVPAEQEGV